MLKPKFRDIGKFCHSLDGDIYSELDYNWITNQFPNTEENLIPSECIKFSDMAAEQSHGRSVFYSCLGPADAQGTQNPMQVFYRERYRPESKVHHRPYRISRILVNETSPESQYELVGPLAFYQARYAEGVKGLQSDHAQSLPGLTEELGQQINHFGYIYGDTQDRSETDQYQKLIELIVSYICDGQSVSLWQQDIESFTPVEEPIFYQIAQRVWESLPSKSLQVLFSAAWGSEEIQSPYTLICPSEGRFKGDSKVVYLTKDDSWTDYEGWLRTTGQGYSDYQAIRSVSALQENQTFEPFVDFINWDIKQSGINESAVGVPFYHRSEAQARSLSGHLDDLLKVRGKPGEMFKIPWAFDECTEDPFGDFPDQLPEFNIYQVDLRINDLYKERRWGDLYKIINWGWYDSINRQQVKHYTSYLRDMKFIKKWEYRTKDADLKHIHEGHDAIYKKMKTDSQSNGGVNRYFWYRDEAKLIPELPTTNTNFTSLYDQYVYLKTSSEPFSDKEYDWICYVLNSEHNKEHIECMNYVADLNEAGPWSEFKKKIHNAYTARERSIIDASKALETELATLRELGSRLFGTNYLSSTNEHSVTNGIRDGSSTAERREHNRSVRGGSGIGSFSEPIFTAIPSTHETGGRRFLQRRYAETQRLERGHQKKSITFGWILTAISIAFIMFMLYMIYYNRTHHDKRVKASPAYQYQPAKSLRYND